MTSLARVLMAGWATGERSFSATAVLLNSGSGAGLPGVLRTPAARRLAALAAAGELVGDKLPQAPPRTAPPALVPRLVLAALCGAVLGRRDGAATVGAAAAGALAAAASSFAGPPVRAALAGRFGSDLPGALAEDLAAYALAAAAVRA